MSKITKIVKCEKKGKDVISYGTIPLDEYEGIADERALSHGFVMDLFRVIMGRTLTIIDASISEPKQNKAMKDLLREVFNERMQFVADFAYDQGELCEMANREVENLSEEEIVPISIEEALGIAEKE